jgi:hypothetical protein
LHQVALTTVEEKRVSWRKLRLLKAPEARKLLFQHRRSAKAVAVFFSAEIPLRRNKSLFIKLTILFISCHMIYNFVFFIFIAIRINTLVKSWFLDGAVKSSRSRLARF